MSVKYMGAVWDLDLPHPKQSILLAMADHADHDGNNIFPSVGLVAWKTGYSVNQARRIIQQLVKDGLLVPVSERPGEVKRYRMDLSKAKRKEPYTPPKMGGEDSHSYVTPTPPIAMGVDPSIEPSIESNTPEAEDKMDNSNSDTAAQTPPPTPSPKTWQQQRVEVLISCLYGVDLENKTQVSANFPWGMKVDNMLGEVRPWLPADLSIQLRETRSFCEWWLRTVGTFARLTKDPAKIKKAYGDFLAVYPTWGKNEQPEAKIVNTAVDDWMKPGYTPFGTE